MLEHTMKATIILLLLLAVALFSDGVNAQPADSECFARLEELEGQMTHSNKNMDSLRTDLQYWQNTTLSILKKYLVEREGGSIPVCIS